MTAAARSVTYFVATGLPNPVVRSQPGVVGMPAMLVPACALSPTVTPLNVCGTMSVKSLAGRS